MKSLRVEPFGPDVGQARRERGRQGADELVQRELQRRRPSHLADEPHVPPEAREERLEPLELLRRPAHHHLERPRVRLGDAPQDGRLDPLAARRGDLGREGAALVRADGPHLDDGSPREGGDGLRREEHLADRGSVREHQNRDRRGEESFRRRRHDIQPRLAERRRPRGRPVPDRHGKAGRGEAKGDRCAEEAGAEEGNVAHPPILRPARIIGNLPPAAHDPPREELR